MSTPISLRKTISSDSKVRLPVESCSVMVPVKDRDQKEHCLKEVATTEAFLTRFGLASLQELTLASLSSSQKPYDP